MTANWRDALAAYIREQARPVEKYGHQPRLYALTREIGQGLAYEDDIVCAAAWLHDLGVFLGHRPEDPTLLALWDNTAYATAQAPAILTRLGFPAEKIAAVQACIRTHQPHAKPETIEATLLRDADILEQLGAVGIARTLAKVGRDTRFHTFSDATASLERALRDLPGLIQLPRARELAAPRVQMHTAFLKALAEEAKGDLH